MNTVEIEKIKNTVEIETIDIHSDYYFLQPTQLLEEHKEVSDG